MINYGDGALLWPDQHGGRRLPDGQRGVAIVTQSSNIAINMTMQRRGLPLAYVVTAGNQAQTGLSEIALGLLDDPQVTALRSEEHTSELQSLMRISYADFCLKKKKNEKKPTQT